MFEAASTVSDHWYNGMINPLQNKRARLAESQDQQIPPRTGTFAVPVNIPGTFAASANIPGTVAAPANVMIDTSGDTHGSNSGQIPLPDIGFDAATPDAEIIPMPPSTQPQNRYPLEYYVTYLQEFVWSQEAEHRRIES